MTEKEKLFEKMLNMELTNEEMFEQCRNVAHKPMTNEEYIRTCSTAELVHVIHLMTTSCYVCGSDGVNYRRCYFRKQCTGPKEIEEWLKEIHE